MSRLLLGVVVAAASMWSVSVRADGLFRDVPAAAAAATGPAAPAAKFPVTVKRQRLAMLDPAYLAARVLPDMPMQAGTTMPAKAPSVEVPLFSDLAMTLTGLKMEQTADGRLVWTGQVAGSPGSLAILVSGPSGITGQIFDGTTAIEIRSVGGDAHLIAEIDTDAFPSHEHVLDDQAKPPAAAPRPDAAVGHHHHAPMFAPPPSVRPEQGAPAASPAVAADTSTTLNIYVAYTSATASASTDIVSEIRSAIAVANATFTNSGINAQLNLVGYGQITYTEGTYVTAQDIITKFYTNSDGVMDSIHTLRTASSADLVTLFVENLYNACGIAQVYTGKPSSAFNVVQRSCASSGYTFSHEIGHNLAAYHDRYAESNSTVTGGRSSSLGSISNTYGYGYVDLTGRFRDIMAYRDKCTAAGISCPAIPYFSNPDVSYQGRPVGTARSDAESADVARRINQTAPAVAGFRSSASTPLPESGWWWSSAESGRGYSLEVSGSNAFLAFYSYASDGSSVWYVSSGAMSSANVYFGSLQQYSGGQTLSGSYRAASLQSTPGYVQVNFYNDRNAVIYLWSSATGWSSGTAISRFDFIANGSPIGTASGYPQTGWWWSASEPGRGFFIEAQDTSMYVSFYMYDSSGQATWYVASGTMLSSTLFSGTIYQFSGGSYFTATTFSAPTSSSTLGTVTIQFSATTAATMTLPNGSQVALTRFAF